MKNKENKYFISPTIDQNSNYVSTSVRLKKMEAPDIE